MSEESEQYGEPGTGNSGGWTKKRKALIPEYKQEICRMLSEGMFPGEIAETLDISVELIRRWRAADTEFDNAYEDAYERATDTIEKEAIRRARDGVLDYIVAGGRIVMDPADATKPLMRRVYSDDLLKFVLKGRRRSVYGDQPVVQQTVVMDADGVRSELERKFDSLASTKQEE
jgi:hypothetical protein